MNDKNYDTHNTYKKQLSEVKEQIYGNRRQLRELEILQDENQEVMSETHELLKEMEVSKDKEFSKHIYAVGAEFIKCRRNIEGEIEDRKRELYEEKRKLEKLEEDYENNYRKKKLDIENSHKNKEGALNWE